MDDSGPIQIPVKLRLLFPDDLLIINIGFRSYLSLYNLQQWKIITDKLSELNSKLENNRKFIRLFYRGDTELRIDKRGRIPIPLVLIDYIQISKNIALLEYPNCIEIWNPEMFKNESVKYLSRNLYFRNNISVIDLTLIRWNRM